MRAEISYDLVMADDMEFVEGTFRFPGGEWQVCIFSRSDVLKPEVEQSQGESGVTGLLVRFPRTKRLNQAAVESVLSAVLGVQKWGVVLGPDSIQLR